ncbi:accessory gene regulator B family protein [Clostridium sp. PL3]|uniref:Accessory gene regulator B family protein n=1 Tax=Clostridium thailandense TaxID=2794346 RepID=A0A949TXX4_9CLOT|nr:accessory gene regulator B family protein [Clostridium thailandense]MBV7273886.1 accessory gene regulator B family protein [Clostridium thailandense]
MGNFISCLVKEISKTNSQFSDLELKKMEYGLTCLWDEITKLIPYFIIFWLFSVQGYYIVTLIFFCPIRLFTGGYHAKTYWGCFFISFVIFSLIIVIGKYISFNTTILIAALIISFILVCIYSPVDNINKRIKSKETRMKLKRFSIIITFCLSLLCYFIPCRFLPTAALSIISATMLMIIGKTNDT